MSSVDTKKPGAAADDPVVGHHRDCRPYLEYFEDAPIYCYRVSAEGLIVDVNRTALDFLGYEKDELVGFPVQSIYSRESRDKASELFSAIKAGGDIKNEELEIQSKSGERQPVLFSATARRAPDGSLIETISIQREISELKTLQRELVEEKDRASRYLDIANVMIIALDAEGKVTLANRKAAEVLGRPSSEIVGLDWFDSFIPEKLRTEVSKVFRNLIEGNVEPVKRYINKVIATDGTERMVEWYNSNLTDKDGRITGILSSGEDVTERSIMEAELAKRQDMMSRIADTVLDALVMIDDSASVQYWNKAAERIFGYTSAEAVGRPLPSLIVPEKYLERLTAGFSRFVATGEGELLDRTVEMVGKRKDGTEFPVEHSISSMNVDGRWHAVGIIRDITERKAAEEKLAERLEELERFRKATVGREFKLHELKLEIEQLNKRIKELDSK